jgi:hypothetical protein
MHEVIACVNNTLKNNKQGHYTLHSNSALLKQERHNIQRNYNTIFSKVAVT